MIASKWRWLVIVLSVVSCGFARSYQDIIAEAKRQVIRSEDYAFNDEVTVQLKLGEAIQLICPENRHEIDCFLIYFHETEIKGESELILRADALFKDGGGSGGGSRVSSLRAMRQASHSDCVMISEWTVRDKTATVQFWGADDTDFIRENYRQWTSQGLHFSKAFRDYRFIPPVELPEAERLAGFTRLWSEVKYNFAFFDQVPELDWDRVLVEYIPKVQAAQTAIAYYDTLRECIALLQDGHTSVSGPSNFPRYEPPIRVEAISNRAVVTQMMPMDQLSEKQREEIQNAAIRIGDLVTHVDGKPISEILKQVIYPYISASTQQALDRKAYPRLLRGDYNSKVILDVERMDGTSTKITFSRKSYRFPRRANDYVCKLLDSGIFYVNLPSFGSDREVKAFAKNFNQIHTAKGLILDVRHNGGGSSRNGYAILSRLVKKEVKGSQWKTRKHIAAYKAWGREEPWHFGNASTIKPHSTQYYSGPVVVLTGAGTVSAAEDFVVAFQMSQRGKVIGEPTNGSTGQPLMVKLPGGGSARICTKWDSYPDGREFVGVGCIPDIEVKPTRENIAAECDVVLDKAVEFLSSQ